jgi:hypothetical protein
MIESLEVMKKVTEELKRRGYPAVTLEYPGYISIHGLAFGDSNPTWCWNDHEGCCGGESKIPTESEDVAAIANWVVEVLTKDRDARTAAAIDAADTALWDAVVKAFPEAKSGDLGPLASHELTQAIQHAITEWVYYNVPKTCGTCGVRLDEADEWMDSKGCIRCADEFCSAACAEKHEADAHGVSA